MGLLQKPTMSDKNAWIKSPLIAKLIIPDGECEGKRTPKIDTNKRRERQMKSKYTKQKEINKIDGSVTMVAGS